METNMKIPKVIHYCWFGKKEQPTLIKQCINSWKKELKGYEIIEWNEQNFDISTNNYVKEAYNAGKFAFVSDYVRLYALYHYGGIYLDTDVEVYKRFDDFLHHDTFWGFEQESYIATSTIGAEKENKFIKKMLDYYEEMNFKNNDGSYQELTNVAIITKVFEEKGLKKEDTFQEIQDIGAIYPQVYFSPYDYINCYNKKTEQSVTCHYFYKSWLSFFAKFKTKIKKILAATLGGQNIVRIRKWISK